MILTLFGGACFLLGSYWFLLGSYTSGEQSIVNPRYWLLFSLIASFLGFVYLLSRFLSDTRNTKRGLQLVLFVGLFSIANLVQWDKDHSGVGMGEDSPPHRCAGLFGTSEPLVLDFASEPPQLSSRWTGHAKFSSEKWIGYSPSAN